MYEWLLVGVGVAWVSDKLCVSLSMCVNACVCVFARVCVRVPTLDQVKKWGLDCDNAILD